MFFFSLLFSTLFCTIRFYYNPNIFLPIGYDLKEIYGTELLKDGRAKSTDLKDLVVTLKKTILPQTKKKKKKALLL